MARNFEVSYVDLRTGEPTGETVRVRALNRNQTTELAALVESLLSKFLYYGRLPGEVLRSDNVGVWSDMRKIAAMLPLEGGGELDLDRIDDDQLLRIFFTNSTCQDEDGGLIHDEKLGERSLLPSEICKINGISFFDLNGSHKGMLRRALEGERKLRQEELDKLKKELTQAEASPTTPTPTPSPSSPEPLETIPASPSTSGKTSRKRQSTTSSAKLAS